MTDNNEQLLLIDLCARQPYRVKVLYEGQIKEIQYIEPLYNEVKLLDTNYTIPIYEIKPYFRPMSSMTVEEEKEFKSMLNYAGTCDCFLIPLKVGKIIDTNFALLVDWLNKKMFDYRGLIPKGLAIEVTKENNPYAN